MKHASLVVSALVLLASGCVLVTDASLPTGPTEEAVLNAIEAGITFIHEDNKNSTKPSCCAGPVILRGKGFETPVGEVSLDPADVLQRLPMTARTLLAADDYWDETHRYGYDDWKQLAREDVLLIDVGTLAKETNGWSLIVHGRGILLTGHEMERIFFGNPADMTATERREHAKFVDRQWVPFGLGMDAVVYFDGKTGEVFEAKHYPPGGFKTPEEMARMARRAHR